MTWGKGEQKPMPSWWAVLHISPDATPDEIEAKYQKMSRQLHQARIEGKSQNG